VGAPEEVESLVLGGGELTELSWTPTSGADHFDLARGSLSDIHDRSYGACLRDDLAATSTTDSGNPDPGNGFYYLVRGVHGATCAAGPYGYDSEGSERESIDLDRCP
jgi:hypothetical protein